MNRLTLIYPYYDNPAMLEMQLANWKSYPVSLAERIRVIVVDDGSQRFPAAPCFERVSPSRIVELYRINENIPWNQDGAKNLGAHLADDGARLLLSDIDIVVAPDVAEIISNIPITDRRTYYMFNRAVVRRNGETFKPHPNTFLLGKSLFWSIGGYDEDYCGTYGSDRDFRERLAAAGKGVYRGDIVLRGYDAEVVPDATTYDWDRSEYLKKFIERREEKIRTGRVTPEKPLRFTWQRVFP